MLQRTSYISFICEVQLIVQVTCGDNFSALFLASFEARVIVWSSFRHGSGTESAYGSYLTYTGATIIRLITTNSYGSHCNFKQIKVFFCRCYLIVKLDDIWNGYPLCFCVTQSRNTTTWVPLPIRPNVTDTFNQKKPRINI